jgi:perosamine synthetase
MIPYGRHALDEDDIQAVTEVLRRGYLTQGPKVEEFERSVASYVGAKYAVAVSSGTAALHIACLAAHLGPGDAIVTSPNTFVASANCALFVGATPHFADIHPETLNMHPQKLAKQCAQRKNVKAVIPVHFAGLPCDMPAIEKIAQASNALVIEDASHALGAVYPKGGRVGNCAHSLMTVFSFHPVKMVTSGEGGLITTNHEGTYRHLLRLRSHGITKGNDPFLAPERAYQGTAFNPWYYEMQHLGFNYRITDIQCALAISQMKKLDRFIARRREIALRYDKAFSNISALKRVQAEGGVLSSHHLYVLRIQFSKLGLSRQEFMTRLKENGVGSQVHYIPVPMHPYYRQNYPAPESDYAEALAYYEEGLSLPLYPALTEEDIAKVIESVSLLCKNGFQKSVDSDRRMRVHRQATR